MGPFFIYSLFKRGAPFCIFGIFNRGDPLFYFWDFKKGPPPESATAVSCITPYMKRRLVCVGFRMVDLCDV